MKYLIELTFSGFFSYKVNIMDLPTWPEGKLGHYKSVKELIADGCTAEHENYAMLQLKDSLLVPSIATFHMTENSLTLKFNAFNRATKKHNGYYVVFDINENMITIDEQMPMLSINNPMNMFYPPWPVDLEFLRDMEVLHNSGWIRSDDEGLFVNNTDTGKRISLNEKRWRPTCALYTNAKGVVCYRDFITSSLIEYYSYVLRGA